MKMSKTNKIKFGKNLKVLREGCCMTQQQLAIKAGLAVPTICRIEKGSGASLTTRTKLAAALGLAVDELKGE
jgi:DNA-binding XRE family transcriptional regulator